MIWTGFTSLAGGGRSGGPERGSFGSAKAELSCCCGVFRRAYPRRREGPPTPPMNVRGIKPLIGRFGRCFQAETGRDPRCSSLLPRRRRRQAALPSHRAGGLHGFPLRFAALQSPGKGRLGERGYGRGDQVLRQTQPHGPSGTRMGLYHRAKRSTLVHAAAHDSVWSAEPPSFMPTTRYARGGSPSRRCPRRRCVRRRRPAGRGLRRRRRPSAEAPRPPHREASRQPSPEPSSTPPPSCCSPDGSHISA